MQVGVQEWSGWVGVVGIVYKIKAMGWDDLTKGESTWRKGKEQDTLAEALQLLWVKEKRKNQPKRLRRSELGRKQAGRCPGNQRSISRKENVSINVR